MYSSCSLHNWRLFLFCLHRTWPPVLQFRVVTQWIWASWACKLEKNETNQSLPSSRQGSSAETIDSVGTSIDYHGKDFCLTGSPPTIIHHCLVFRFVCLVYGAFLKNVLTISVLIFLWTFRRFERCLQVVYMPLFRFCLCFCFLRH